jgi:hypothetical protein
MAKASEVEALLAKGVRERRIKRQPVVYRPA